MSQTTAMPDPEEVLEHLDWVRGLALSLVGDPAEADDLRQEVWVLSRRLNRPSRIPLKAWLSGLLRNKVRDRRRAANTRAHHEQGSALERASSINESHAVRQASMHQVVVERLMRLREPYRSTLLARYFDDLSHAEIATRDGVAIATVRSRLQRGLAELRGELGQEQHSQGSLLALLALQTWSPDVLASHAAPASAWMPWAIIAVVGTGAGITMLWPDSKSTDPGIAKEEPLVAQVPEAKVDLDPTPAERQPVVTPAAQTTSETETGSTTPVASAASSPGSAPVEIIDLDEQPVPGVEVFFLRYLPDGNKAPGPSAFTDKDGKALVEGIEGRGILFCPTTAGVQLGHPNAGGQTPSKDTVVLVVAPATFLSGQILSESNIPMPGVRIRLGFQQAFKGAIGRSLAHSNHASFKTQSDSQGRFTLKIPKSSEPMGLIAEFVGYEDRILTGFTFDSDPEPLAITMQAFQDPNACFGTVASETGELLVGAWVADGTQVVRTQADGTFQLGLVPVDADLWAGARGYAPKKIVRKDDLQQIELVLSKDQLTITGRVLYPEGNGAEGIQVRLQSEQPVGTHFYFYGGRKAFSAMSAEAFAYPSRGTVPSRAMAITSSDGSFSLQGLLPREYTLEIFDHASLQQLTGLQFAAGSSEVRIDFPSQPASLYGSVRTPSGVALPGVLVRSMASEGEFRQGPQIRSDAEGKFHFENLARGSRVLADVDLPWVHLGSIADQNSPLDLLVEPAARVHLTLDLKEGFSGRPRLPKTAFFLDAEGVRVPFVVDDIRYYRQQQIPIEAKESGMAQPTPMIVPTRAEELVLQDQDGPVLVLTLDLKPGQDHHVIE